MASTPLAGRDAASPTDGALMNISNPSHGASPVERLQRPSSRNPRSENSLLPLPDSPPPAERSAHREPAGAASLPRTASSMSGGGGASGPAREWHNRATTTNPGSSCRGGRGPVELKFPAVSLTIDGARGGPRRPQTGGPQRSDGGGGPPLVVAHDLHGGHSSSSSAWNRGPALLRRPPSAPSAIGGKDGPHSGVTSPPFPPDCDPQPEVYNPPLNEAEEQHQQPPRMLPPLVPPPAPPPAAAGGPSSYPNPEPIQLISRPPLLEPRIPPLGLFSDDENSSRGSVGGRTSSDGEEVQVHLFRRRMSSSPMGDNHFMGDDQHNPRVPISPVLSMWSG